MSTLQELAAQAAESGGRHKLVLYKEDGMCWVRRGECEVPKPAPKTPAWWQDGLAVTLMREGINKHRAREIAAGYWTAYCETEKDLRTALQEADTIMNHEDAATEWRERWESLWTAT